MPSQINRRASLVCALLALNLSPSLFAQVFTVQLGPPAPAGLINGTYLSIVKTNTVTLSGTNMIPNSARVTVNGSDAVFNAGTGQWSKTQMLSPGFNRLLIEVLDNGSVLLLSTNKDIVAELSSASLGGTLGHTTSLESSMGVFHVTNTVLVPSGGTLSIGPGCVFLMSTGANFLGTNATLNATGTESNAIYFLPADGTSVWGELAVSGTSAHLLAQHIETIAGHVEVFNGAVGTLEDSYFHHYEVPSPAIIHTLGQPNHVTLNLRRCHVAHYYEILSQLATNHIEDCLCEYQAAGGDGIDFDAGQRGSYIRRCTVRHAKFTNVDALDMGEFIPTGEGSRGVFIDSCLLYDFADKGVSMGVKVDVTVSNCLIYAVDSGVAVKDDSIAGIYNNTIVGNNFGYRCYNKANPASPSGGGYITNSYNNVLWSNGETISLMNGSTLAASYCDFQATNYPGIGNFDSDPLFVNPAQRDYRVAANSPTIGAGLGGANLGATFPVGAAMAPSHPRIESFAAESGALKLRFYVDPEKTYTVQYRDVLGSGSWQKLTDVYPQPLPRLAEVADTIPAIGNRFYRLVSPKQP